MGNETLRGIHCWWTKPKTGKDYDDNYVMEDYDLITLILSAKFWKKHYGHIELYTDETMVNFLKKTGIWELNLWDSVNTKVVTEVPEIINPKVYWAGFKFQVMKQLTPPFAMVDVDLFLIKKYVFDYSKDVIYLHPEDKTYPAYPSPAMFVDKYPPYSWELPFFASNVGLLFVNNQEFLNEYVTNAMDFMTHPAHNADEKYDNYSSRMIFIEQAMLGLMLEEKKMTYKSDSVIKDIFQGAHNFGGDFFENMNGESNYDEIKDTFYHTWGHKKLIKVLAKFYKSHMMINFQYIKTFPGVMEVYLNAIERIKEMRTEEEYVNFLNSNIYKSILGNKNY